MKNTSSPLRPPLRNTSAERPRQSKAGPSEACRASLALTTYRLLSNGSGLTVPGVQSPDRMTRY